MPEQNYNETAHRILDAAELFTQTQGFNAFSYKDVAAMVKVKTSSIHYYFPTKKDLATAMSQRYIDSFVDNLNAIDKKYAKASDKLTALGEMFVEVANADKHCLCGMLSSEILSIPRDCLEELRGFYQKVEDWIERVMSQGVTDGDLNPTLNAANAAAHFLATLEGGLLIARSRENADYLKTIIDEGLSHLIKDF